MWEACKNNNGYYDGAFYYGVKTTGIFCRPSCKSKLPKRENVEFFRTVAANIDRFPVFQDSVPELPIFFPPPDITESLVFQIAGAMAGILVKATGYDPAVPGDDTGTPHPETGVP